MATSLHLKALTLIHRLGIRLTQSWLAGRAGRRLISVKYGFAAERPESPAQVDYYNARNSGFFSNCSTSAADISMLHTLGRQVERIDFSLSMLLYKKHLFADTYLDYFAPITPDATLPPAGVKFDALGALQHYRDLDFPRMLPIVERYFAPSRRIKALEAGIVAKLKLDPSRTIAVYYRGTDKFKEIVLGDVHAYCEAVHAAERGGEPQHIFLQTDDAAVLAIFKKEFAGRISTIDELATSLTTTGLHKAWRLWDRHFDEDRQIAHLFASVLIMAACKTLIVTTSNVAYWAVLYRGHARGVQQFDQSARLIPSYPNEPSSNAGSEAI